LMGNPVFLGGLGAGAVWLLARRPTRLAPAGATLLVGLTAAIELSGSRLALALAAAVVVAVLADRGLRTAAARAACVVVGRGLGAAVGHVARTPTVTARSEVSSGVRPRVETWLSARHALARHPFLGSGPGRFRAATSRYR